MRVIAEIPHSKCKISIFYMNGKYIIQFSSGAMEQSFKISELDYIIKDAEDVKKIISEEFIETVLNRFADMHKQLTNALKDY